MKFFLEFKEKNRRRDDDDSRNGAKLVNDALYTDKVQVERKLFFFDLKENPRGRFLRITEDVNGRRNSIVIPTAGLEDFRRIIDGVIENNKKFGQPTVQP